LCQCENLSHETGCWLYLGGQHVTASSGFTHYASPRLRRDAKNPLAEIQQKFNAMFTALVSSRRREAVDLAMQLTQAQELQKEAETEAEEARLALAEEQLTAATKDALIARLQAMIDSHDQGSIHKEN
jgi:hypothetical protein